mmetsp:Transcript_126368/g.365827  ORF Transcript_126368/g.365827 Transcript_126368/m.365827 type:complete len:185 (+) Transcript_126368:296-850(+)
MGMLWRFESTVNVTAEVTCTTPNSHKLIPSTPKAKHATSFVSGQARCKAKGIAVGSQTKDIKSISGQVAHIIFDTIRSLDRAADGRRGAACEPPPKDKQRPARAPPKDRQRPARGVSTVNSSKRFSWQVVFAGESPGRLAAENSQVAFAGESQERLAAVDGSEEDEGGDGFRGGDGGVTGAGGT